MSYILTSTLPCEANWELLLPIILKFNKSFKLLNNPHVMSQIPKGFSYFKTTNEVDDNNTSIGLISTNLNMMNEYIRDTPMFTYTGWHCSLNDNLKDQCINSYKKLSKERKDELEMWIDFIKDLLYQGKIKKVGILKHFYSDDVELENFAIKKILTVKIEDIDLNYLLNIQEDILYEFVD